MFKISVAVLLAFAGLCEAQSYTYTKVVETGPSSPFSGMEPLGISSNGMVLFLGKQKDGVTGVFVATGGGGYRKAIDDSGEIHQVMSGAINSSGRIVLSCLMDDGAAAVLLVDGGAPKTIFRSQDPADLAGAVLMAPRINDLGQVVVTLRPHLLSPLSSSVLIHDGTNQAVIATPTDLAAAITVLNADINNKTDVTFVATTPTGGGLLFFSPSSGYSLILANSAFGHTFQTATDTPALNDAGAIAFEAWGDDFVSGIWLYTPGSRTPALIARDRGAFNRVSRPMLNNKGVVAFTGETPQNGTGYGIYIHQNGVQTKVIANQDVIFGGRVSVLPMSRQGRYFDDEGRVVFTYVLDAATLSGGIALASPAGAPAVGQPILTAGSASNGATYLPGGLVPGSWAQVKGTSLAPVSRLWQAQDFAGLNDALPTKLDGVEVKVNGQSAAVYFISPTQITFQVPDVPPGEVSIQVIRDGVASASITATAAARSPGIFPYALGGKVFAIGVFLDGKLTGDPANGEAFRKAKAGDVIQLFATGLEISAAGQGITPRLINGVTVTVGDVRIPAEAAALVDIGLFQVNFRIPEQFSTMAEAEYPIAVEIGGVSSPARINAGQTTAPVLIPIQP